MSGRSYPAISRYHAREAPRKVSARNAALVAAAAGCHSRRAERRPSRVSAAVGIRQRRRSSAPLISCSNAHTGWVRVRPNCHKGITNAVCAFRNRMRQHLRRAPPRASEVCCALLRKKSSMSTRSDEEKGAEEAAAPYSDTAAGCIRSCAHRR